MASRAIRSGGSRTAPKRNIARSKPGGKAARPDKTHSKPTRQPDKGKPSKPPGEIKNKPTGDIKNAPPKETGGDKPNKVFNDQGGEKNPDAFKPSTELLGEISHNGFEDAPPKIVDSEDKGSINTSFEESRERPGCFPSPQTPDKGPELFDNYLDQLKGNFAV